MSQLRSAGRVPAGHGVGRRSRPSSMQLAAALDQPVGVEDERRAGRDGRRRPRCTAAGPASAEHGAGAGAVEEADPPPSSEQRRRVPGARPADRARGSSRAPGRPPSTPAHRAAGRRSGRAAPAPRPDRSPCSSAADSALRSWPMTAAAAGPCPTTSPTAIATRSLVELDDVVPVAAGLGALGAGQVVGRQREPSRRGSSAGSRLRCSVSAMPLLGPVEPGPVEGLGALLGQRRAAWRARSREYRCDRRGKPMPMTPTARPADGQRQAPRRPRARRPPQLVGQLLGHRPALGGSRRRPRSRAARRSRTAVGQRPAGPAAARSPTGWRRPSAAPS